VMGSLWMVEGGGAGRWPEQLGGKQRCLRRWCSPRRRRAPYTVQPMQPSDWVSLAALGLAALSVVIGPIIAARLSRRARTDEDRRRVYSVAVGLMRGAELEIEAARSFLERETNPRPEVEAMLADLLLVGSADVQTKVERFFRLYWAGMTEIGVWASAFQDQELEMQQQKLREVSAELNLTTALDETLNAMREDLGVPGKVKHRARVRDVEQERGRRWGYDAPK
jgi:hypothetical protein